MVREYRSGDIDRINLHPAYADDTDVRERHREACEMLGADFCRTILSPSGDKVLAVVAGYPIFTKVMDLYAVVDKSVDEHHVYYAKAMKCLIDTEFDRRGLNRVQIHILADMPWAARWASFLGFVFEGRLRHYGEENKDHFLFAKWRD